MEGGAGDDVYWVDVEYDYILDTEGHNTVYASSSYTLTDGVATLKQTGTANIDATGTGEDNTLVGNAGVNRLYGLGGRDRLDGGAGADIMDGGADTDVYYVDDVNDEIIEAPTGGKDTIYASVSYSLAARAQNVEKLKLTGSAIEALGTSGNDTLIGNAEDNDLDGAGGIDRLTGGDGADTFHYSGSVGSDNVIRISDFVSGEDVMRLSSSTFVFFFFFFGAVGEEHLRVGSEAVDNNDFFVYNKDRGFLYFDADANGDQAAQRFALLTPGTELKFTDFFDFSA